MSIPTPIRKLFKKISGSPKDKVMETACLLHFGRKVRWCIIGFSMVCGVVGEGFLSLASTLSVQLANFLCLF